MTDKVHRDKFIERELLYIQKMWAENLPEHDDNFTMLTEAYNMVCIHLDHIISRANGDFIVGLDMEEKG